MSEKRIAPRKVVFLLLLATHYFLLTTVFAGCGLFRSQQPVAETPLEQVKHQIHQKGPAALTAGVARVEITPAVGTPLAGYSKRKGKPSVGIRDPLYVRVLSMSDGDDRWVLVSADLLLFPDPMVEEILQQVAHDLRIARQQIVLAGTHTHSGTGSIAPGFLYEKVFGPYRSEVVKGITGRVIWGVRQAIEHEEPARWGVGSRENLLEGWVENRRAPSGSVDPDLRVLLVESMKGQPLGILVSATAHPTLMDSKDLRFSGDYPGELAQAVEGAYPGAVCLFANGAAGDTRPRDAVGNSSDERVSRFGKLLAEATVGLVNRMSLESKGDLAAWGWWVPLPPPQIHLGPIPIHPRLGRLMRPSSAYLHLLALDRTLFVPLSAEMTADLGLELKRKIAAQGLDPILVGYADGYLGYAVTPKQYEDRSYESWMTWYGPTFGIILVEKFRQLASIYSEKE